MLAGNTGIFLIGSSLFLFIPSFQKPIFERFSKQTKYLDVLCIGMAQSLALFPGISRSGSTISTARLLGWTWQEAVRFSFLLAVPTILGGLALEIAHYSGKPVDFSLCATGFLASFIVGSGTIHLLFLILNRTTLRPFAWYCLGLGVILMIWQYRY